jgi:hypothetical protein
MQNADAVRRISRLSFAPQIMKTVRFLPDRAFDQDKGATM